MIRCLFLGIWQDPFEAAPRIELVIQCESIDDAIRLCDTIISPTAHINFFLRYISEEGGEWIEKSR